ARLNELLEHVWPKQPAFQLTIAVVFLFVGYVIGFRVDGAKDNSREEVAQLRNEVLNMQRLVTLSLLKVGSASERMKGVSWSEQIRQPDTEVMGALVQALNYDPNVNVRLAAMDALTKFADQPEIKHVLVQSLPKQSSPLIQLALVDVIAETKNTEAAGTFKQMLEQQNLNQTVKERIKERMADLSQ
ncbi:MAG: HEAT repeat domain-containing protein, partial [Ignavibacteriales bacterium]|nr:HEAT repeat domain-containing protein [Ignavibacteriales bacterium]